MLIFLLLGSATGWAQKDSIEATIVRFFDGLSERSAEKIREQATSDMLLLEQGEVWNLDTLIHYVTGAREKFDRINSFEFIRTVQQGDIAWVSYHNKAEFIRGDKRRSIHWLESAVLTRENGRWKIRQMHSTIVR